MNPEMRRTGLLVESVGDELVVYDRERHSAHRLNKAVALTWHYCDGRRTIAEISGRLQEELSQPMDENLVWLAVEQLRDVYLLQELPRRPTDADRGTRRRVMQQLSRVGLLAALMPVITSIAAPTPAQAQTIMCW